MAYELEDLRQREPACLIEEHGLLKQWLIEHPRIWDGVDPRRRLVDRESSSAVYGVAGLGMGDGIALALIRGRDVVVFDVWWDSRSAMDVRRASIRNVRIPERVRWSRQEIQTQIVRAFESYALLTRLASPGVVVDVEKVSWEVRTAKYSSLYFRRLVDQWVQRQKPKVRRLRDHLKSPLVALLLLGLALLWPAPASWGWVQRVPSLLASAWVIRRFLQYDSDYFFGLWFVGIAKLRNPLQVFGMLGRVTQPRPLAALGATVELSPRSASCVQITITNRSLWPVEHLSVPRAPLAGLLAPQSLAAMRAGQLDRKAFDARVPDLRRRWLWPRQSVSWAVVVEPAEVPPAFPPQLEVLLCISRFASGERRSGPNTYLIPITVLKP